MIARPWNRPRACAWAALALLLALVQSVRAGTDETIARIKHSVVGVGTFERERSPNFAFRGTGFAIGDGRTIVTNAHVLPTELDVAHEEALAILVPAAGGRDAEVRTASQLAIDPAVDLALLHFDGDPLPPLTLRDPDRVREGDEILMTGFPLGAVLGPFAATHRGMVAAITPIAIPQAVASNLSASLVHRLQSGPFRVFQLDLTAYPGNSGSPIYDPKTGEVLGIVNMVFVKGTKEAALTNPSGITYAIPAQHLAALLATVGPHPKR
ncbi:MAG TPA: serine protease [Casimicrobiaceae bacterium]|nr:serine protease [Casimicrobiaceae bacterium]